MMPVLMRLGPEIAVSRTRDKGCDDHRNAVRIDVRYHVRCPDTPRWCIIIPESSHIDPNCVMMTYSTIPLKVALLFAGRKFSKKLAIIFAGDHFCGKVLRKPTSDHFSNHFCGNFFSSHERSFLRDFLSPCPNMKN